MNLGMSHHSSPSARHGSLRSYADAQDARAAPATPLDPQNSWPCPGPAPQQSTATFRYAVMIFLRPFIQGKVLQLVV